MLEIQNIIKNRQDIIQRLNKRYIVGIDQLINKVIELDEKRKSLQQQRETLQVKIKALTKHIQVYLKEGKADQIDSIKKEIGQIKSQIKTLENESSKNYQELRGQLINLPNVPHPSVPLGKNETDNEIIKEKTYTLSEITIRQPHWELIKKYDIIDFDLGSKVTGSGFPFYKNKGAKLQRGLINFFLDEAIKAGYIEIQPPILVNEATAFSTGQLPDKEGQMYYIEGEKYYCIPTAEVPLTNIYRDKILKSQELPIKMVGYTPCFRREAGSWGANVRGLNRLHQFDKVEIVQITKAEISYATLDNMIDHVSGLLDKLQLTYRIVRLCGGDLGFTSALTYDFEVYAAGQDKWLEVSSVSNFETFQSNRLKLRIKEDRKTKLLHTLNGSALALPRIIAALLENNQTKDNIFMPEVLRHYCGYSYI